MIFSPSFRKVQEIAIVRVIDHVEDFSELGFVINALRVDQEPEVFYEPVVYFPSFHATARKFNRVVFQVLNGIGASEGRFEYFEILNFPFP